MMNMYGRIISATFAYLFLTVPLFCQKLKDFQWNGNGLRILSVVTSMGEKVQLKEPVPLFTFHLRDKLLSSDQVKQAQEGNHQKIVFTEGITVTLKIDSTFSNGWKSIATFRNTCSDTLELYNIVPFGESPGRIYLTAAGPMELARAKIFRPGLGPVDVVLPDNVWSMGYGDLPLADTISVCAIARRTNIESATRKRYSTILPPGGSVEYTIYAETYSGNWQEGLKLMFRDRYLYDLDNFDNTLFNRKDLQWIRHAYTMALQASWDHDFYDTHARKYTVYQFLSEGKRLFGGYDVYGLWPTFPRLGLDRRNQFDMYRELPFGLDKLKELANFTRQQGTCFFISYNPWDTDTRQEKHLAGLSKLIGDIGADGVVLDTQGASSQELQMAADSARPGVIMYSEGMAVPKDMPGIVAGRVHDAIFFQPPLNLNKLIKPEFAIFRVCQLSQGRIHRETAISFFNGYGTEINTFAPGRPSWVEEEYLFLGRTTRILRGNSDAFLDHNWTPLIPSRHDSIWINHWQDGNKHLYTIFSLLPGGFSGPLFEADLSLKGHWVSLWNHEELKTSMLEHKFYVPVNIASFNSEWLRTRMEGSLECVALFPELIGLKLSNDNLFIKVPGGHNLKLWKGNPSYQDKPAEYTSDSITIKLRESYPGYEGKLVAELFDGNKLLDERVIELGEARIRLISQYESTRLSHSTPVKMAEIPGGLYVFTSENADEFIPYPPKPDSVVVKMKRFFMDQFPVTNKDFLAFLTATGYRPSEPANFLKHWENGVIPGGLEDYPVVYISLEDARAYAKWAGKRLPTEIEWQYAAQGKDGRKYPWGNEFQATKCNNAFGQPTPVDAFPKGKSPFGVQDLVGNIWQLTNDEYDNGSYYFVIIKGGSFYRPASSMWYPKGGPQPVMHRQMLLRVSQGLDRCETIGFRCVMDAEQ